MTGIGAPHGFSGSVDSGGGVAAGTTGQDRAHDPQT
jgi:hypothetical protein